MNKLKILIIILMFKFVVLGYKKVLRNEKLYNYSDICISFDWLNYKIKQLEFFSKNCRVIIKDYKIYDWKCRE